MTEIRLETPFEGCETCKYFKLESTYIEEDSKIQRVFICKNEKICLNAIEVKNASRGSS